MPSFSNFAKPKAAFPPPAETSSSKSRRETEEDDYERRKRRKKEEGKDSSRSSRHKHKSKHKRSKGSPTSSDDEIVSLYGPRSTKQAHSMREEIESTLSSSTAYSIRRTGDYASYKQRGINKLDRPEYYKAYMGALGAPTDFFFSWSADLRTFEYSRRRPAKQVQEDPKKKLRPFEGRYCERGAVATIGKKIKKKTAEELHEESKVLEFGVIPITKDTVDDLSGESIRKDEYEEQEAMEMKFLAKNKELSAAIANAPQDVSLWLQLIQLQDEFSNLISGTYRKHHQSLGNANTKVVLEKKLDIYDKALEIHKDNIELIVGRFEVLRALKDSTTVNNEWIKKISLRADSAPLWLAYLRFVQSNFNHFSISHYRTVYTTAIRYLNREKVNFMKDGLLHPFESVIVEIIIKAVTVEYQAGYQERALAILQALIETNFFAPVNVRGALKEFESNPSVHTLSSARFTLVSSFKSFWDSNLPKFGECGSRGWSAEFDAHDYLKPSIDLYDPLSSHFESSKNLSDDKLGDLPKNDSSNFEILAHCQDIEANESLTNANTSATHRESQTILLQRWIATERHKDSKVCFAKRPEEMGEDIDEVVISEDLQNLLVYFHHTEVKLALLRAVFDFIGVFLKKNQSSNSPLLQARWLETEHLEDVFGMLDSSHYPPICSVRAGTQTNEFDIDPPTMPRMMDLLDTSISPRLASSSYYNLARNALAQMLTTDVSADLLNEFKVARILLEGDETAMKLIQDEQENVVLWNAYIRLLTDACVDEKSPLTKKARRTYTKVINTLADRPLVIETIWRAVDMEYRLGDPTRAVGAMFLLNESKGSAAATSSDSLANRIHNASIDYQRRFSAFSNGLAQTISAADASKIQTNLIVSESLEVFFYLSLVCAIFEGLTNHPKRASYVFASARLALSNFSAICPALASKLTWYSERLWMYQVNYLVQEYERRNSNVPLGLAKTQLMAALDLFPSNPFLLSVFAFVSRKSNLLALGRRYFDTELLSQTDGERKKNKLLSFLFAARYEVHEGAYERSRRLFERSLLVVSNFEGNIAQSLLLWQLWLKLEISCGKFKSAKLLLYRAIQACPWAKNLWLQFLEAIAAFLSHSEVEDVFNLMETKEIRLREQRPSSS